MRSVSDFAPAAWDLSRHLVWVALTAGDSQEKQKRTKGGEGCGQDDHGALHFCFSITGWNKRKQQVIGYDSFLVAASSCLRNKQASSNNNNDTYAAESSKTTNSRSYSLEGKPESGVFAT